MKLALPQLAAIAMAAVSVFNASSAPTIESVPVRVTNASANPVPVTVNGGSVSVTATAPLPVTGTLTATLPSSVNVANTPASPLYTSGLNEPARTPAQIHLTNVAFTSSQSVGEVLSGQYVVPAGKRLVVQQVTGFVSWQVSSAPAGVRIWTNPNPNPAYFGGPYGVNGTPVGLFTPGLNLVDGNNVEWVMAQGPVYVDGGTTLWVGVLTTSSSFLSIGSVPSADLTVVGYLVDCAEAACSPIVTQ